MNWRKSAASCQAGGEFDTRTAGLSPIAPVNRDIPDGLLLDAPVSYNRAVSKMPIPLNLGSPAMRFSSAAVACLSLALLLSGASAQDPSPKKPLSVIVFAGQSNMAGSGKAADLPAAMLQPSPNVLAVDDVKTPTAWVPFTPSGNMGPEIVCCHQFAQATGRPVGMIKFAVGGTNLAEQWNPDGGPLYATLKERVAAARKLGNIEIVAILWMQGEKDSRSESMADNYAENLAKLVRQARKDFESPEAIFVCGRVNPHFDADGDAGQTPERYPFTMKVRKAQEGLDLPRTGWVDCDDLAKHGDNLHYNSDGQIELGQRFAKKLIQMMRESR